MSSPEASSTEQEKLEGLGSYTIVVICIAIFCSAASIYLILNEDSMSLWIGAVFGLCGLAMAAYGWALSSMWWFHRKGNHAYWSIFK